MLYWFDMLEVVGDGGRWWIWNGVCGGGEW